MAQKALLTMALLVLGFGAGALGAQDKKTMTATGPVEKVGGELLVISTGGKNMTFITTAKTVVKVAAGGAKQAAAQRDGKEGLKITDVVRVGDQVRVRYSETGGKMMAEEVEVLERRPQSAQPVK
jgi:hypothetical protein